MKRHLATLVVAVALTLVAAAAWAYLSAGSVPGGRGAAAATTVSQGATPAASATGSTVTVSWTATTLTNGQAVSGYRVKRYDAGTQAAQTILTACTGTIATTSCVESGVPNGSWKYTVTPVFATSWQGPESTTSATVTVNHDATAPTNSISLSSVTGGAHLTGTTVYYRGTAAGSLRLTNAVTDAGSGPASSTTAGLAGTTSGWTHAPSAVPTPSGGPFVSNPFAWTAGTTSSPAGAVTGRDVAGNTAVTGLTFTNDSTPPTAGTISYAGGFVSAATITFTTGTDSGSGIATRRLQRAGAALTGGTCGGFGAFVDLGADGPTSPYVDGSLAAGCYQYRYVVTDRVGNEHVATSANVVKVDVGVPAAPSLAFSALTNAYWSGSGSTAYYRSAASAGSVRLTATASAPSGIAAYAFPALGSGWTSTPGAAGVTTYSWTAASPAAPGTRSVTATSNAGATSAGAPFTLTADDAAPTGAGISYTGATTTSSSVNVSLTTGTDSGSGIGTRLLQRASATLTGTTCGSFGSFATVTGGTNPAALSNDTVSRGTCYQYRYVVSDNLGNQAVATSANVVKVLQPYVNAVTTTPGLVNHYRLDESTTSADSMTGTAGVTLQSRAGEIGASWAKVPMSDADAVLSPAGRVLKAGSNTTGAVYIPSGTPAGANYTVEADVHVASNLTNDTAGVFGRADPTSVSAYYVRYEQTSQRWVLYEVDNGTLTSLGQSATQALAAGSTYRLALGLAGTRIRVLVDGVQAVSVTDDTITTAGLAGIALGYGPAPTTVTSSTGIHLDNFRISPPVADAQGANHGDWLGGVLLAVAGAIAGDVSTAATFDGVNDFAGIGRQVSDDFSIEVWFRSTQGIGTSTQWSNGAGLVDGSVAGVANDFGISLRSDGKVVAGSGTDVSIVSASGGYNNGAWHHVVFTRTRATGALALYVDGVAAGSASGASTASLTGAANLTLGRIQSGGNYFAGSLDEVSIYNVVLSPATISAHFGAAS